MIDRFKIDHNYQVTDNMRQGQLWRNDLDLDSLELLLSLAGQSKGESVKM